MFVDTHAHIFMKHFDADRGDVVSRAAAAGVAAVVNVGLDFETNAGVVEFSRTHEGVYAVIGFHPHEASHFDADAFARQVEDFAGDVVALGEFGLDYFKEYSPKEKQLEAFGHALRIADAAGKPVVVHCRDAVDDTIAMLRESGVRHGGVMHCFSGDTDFLKRTLDLGMMISVGGPVTYPRAEKLREVVRAVPRERLMLETDCPYLTPQMHRGKRNEPSFVPEVARGVADVWGVAVEEVGEVTTVNACGFFGFRVG